MPNQPPERRPDPTLEIGISVAGQVGVVVVLIVLGAALGGVWLDRTLGTKPLFTLLLIIGALPTSLYVVYRVALRAVAKMPMPTIKTGRRYDQDEGGQDE